MKKDKKNSTISIIVPVYNSEKTIARCIESILNQNFKNFEVILIDDGSQDNSLKICKNYSEKFSNVYVFTKNNGGVSSARNYGLRQATGKFITFIDSDDFVSENYLNDLITVQLSNNFDIVFGCACDFVDGKYKFRKTIDKNIELNKNNSIEHFFKNDLFAPVCWGNLYKKSLINTIYFDEKMSIAEDSKFLLQCIKNSENNIFISNVNYYYAITDGSLVHSGFNSNWLRELYFDEQLLKEYDNSKFRQLAIDKYVELMCRLLIKYDNKVNKEYNQLFKNLKKKLKIYRKDIIYKSKNYKLKIKYIIALNPFLKIIYEKLK